MQLPEDLGTSESNYQQHHKGPDTHHASEIILTEFNKYTASQNIQTHIIAHSWSLCSTDTSSGYLHQT